MSTKANIKTIAEELLNGTNLIKDDNVDKVPLLIQEANRVFIAGSGRSGFVGRAFANRLMHLGPTVYFVGDTTTPSIRKGDLLIVLSGSGTTASHVSNAKKAVSEGAKLATITIFPENTIGSMADLVVTLPGATDKVANESTAKTVQPLGSMFEQLTFITCDAIIMTLKDALNQSQKEMDYRHANME